MTALVRTKVLEYRPKDTDQWCALAHFHFTSEHDEDRMEQLADSALSLTRYRWRQVLPYEAFRIREMDANETLGPLLRLLA
jgi:hypothetical protein